MKISKMKFASFGTLVICILMISLGVFTSVGNNTRSFPKSPVIHYASPPLHFNGNDELDAYCLVNGTDGLSWATAHVIANLEIDAGGTNIPLTIENTTRYLIVRDCTLENSQPFYGGIYFYKCENINVTDCIIREGDWEAILLHESKHIAITDNHISDSGDGIGLWDCKASYILISGNTITDVGGYGIVIVDSDYNTISSNTISNAGSYGISLDPQSNNNEVFNNCLKNIGVQDIRDQGVNNNIYDNNCPQPSIPGYLWIILISLVGIMSITLAIIINRRRRS